MQLVGERGGCRVVAGDGRERAVRLPRGAGGRFGHAGQPPARRRVPPQDHARHRPAHAVRDGRRLHRGHSEGDEGGGHAAQGGGGAVRGERGRHDAGAGGGDRDGEQGDPA